VPGCAGSGASALPGQPREGSLDTANVLHAEKISFRSSARLQDTPAQLTATDPRTGSFTLLGIVVHVNPFTECKDSHGNPVDLNSLGTSAVLVRGSVLHGTDVVATRLELTDDPRLILQGPVSAKDAAAGTLVILGVTVDLRSAELQGQGSSSSLSDFLAQVNAGSLVRPPVGMRAPLPATSSPPRKPPSRTHSEGTARWMDVGADRASAAAPFVRWQALASQPELLARDAGRAHPVVRGLVEARAPS
jgi:hypothetical protein